MSISRGSYLYLGLLLTGVSGPAAHAAAGWSGGNAAYYSNATLFKSIFQASRVGTTSSVQITVSANQTPLQFTNDKGENWTLLGISSIWAINPNSVKAGTISGVTAKSNTDNWDKLSGPAGFHDNGTFSNKANWIDLVPNAVLSKDTNGVKTPTGLTSGTFVFDGLAGQMYDVGVDYLIGNESGQYTTGRGYFVPMPTPEPATVAPFVLGGLALFGLARRRAR